MSGRFVAELAYTAQALSRIKRDVAHADVTVLSSSTPEKERCAITRALVYVRLAAMLERVVRDAIRASLHEITALVLPCRDIRASLFSLLCDPQFISVAERSRRKSWDVRISLLDRVLESKPAEFSENVVPMDGRTLRGQHFDVLWSVFGLSGRSLPGALHRLALDDLARGRNDVAHGHVDPVAFGKSKATSDVLLLADKVDQVIEHLVLSLDDYLTGRGYTR